MIPRMLAEPSAEARIVLANALYFKRWQQTFKPDLTKPGTVSHQWDRAGLSAAGRL